MFKLTLPGSSEEEFTTAVFPKVKMILPVGFLFGLLLNACTSDSGVPGPALLLTPCRGLLLLTDGLPVCPDAAVTVMEPVEAALCSPCGPFGGLFATFPEIPSSPCEDWFPCKWPWCCPSPMPITRVAVAGVKAPIRGVDGADRGGGGGGFPSLWDWSSAFRMEDRGVACKWSWYCGRGGSLFRLL